MHFASVIQLALPRGVSDHRPIKLFPMAGDWRSRPFLFENCWLLHKNFLSLVKGWWAQCDCQGFVGFRIVKKMQFLKDQIKKWNRNVFGRLEVDKELVSKKLEEWDLESEESDLSLVNLEARKVDVNRLWELD